MAQIPRLATSLQRKRFNCIYAYIYICIYIYLWRLMSMSILIFMSVCICIYLYIYISIGICICFVIWATPTWSRLSFLPDVCWCGPTCGVSVIAPIVCILLGLEGNRGRQYIGIIRGVYRDYIPFFPYYPPVRHSNYIKTHLHTSQHIPRTLNSKP